MEGLNKSIDYNLELDKLLVVLNTDIDEAAAEIHQRIFNLQFKFVVLEYLFPPQVGWRFWTVNRLTNPFCNGEVAYKEVWHTNNQNEAIAISGRVNITAINNWRHSNTWNYGKL